MKLTLAGDTMLGRGVAERLASAPPTALFSPDLVALAREADLFILNLECAVSDRGSRWPDPAKPFFVWAPRMQWMRWHNSADRPAEANEPSAPPASDDGLAPSAGAAIPGDGLPIDEALESPLAGPLLVKGFLVTAAGTPPRLCSALAESYPPQCGGPSLVIEGLDPNTLDGLVRPDDPGLAGTAWTEKEVSLLGEVKDGGS